MRKLLLSLCALATAGAADLAAIPFKTITGKETSLADYKAQPKIDAPATPERVLWGVEQMRKLKRTATTVEATETTPA